MKKFLLAASLLLTGLFNVNAQTYPFYEDFDAMTSGSAPTGSWVTTGFKVMSGHGWSLPNACSVEMKSTHAADTLVTPLVGPISGNTKISLSYRFVDAALYPNQGHTMGPGDAVTIDAYVGSLLFSNVASLDMNTHPTAMTTWTTYTYTNVLFGSAGSNPCKLRLDVSYGSGDWFLDIDNVIIADVVTGISYSAFNPPAISVAPNPASGSFWLWIKDYKASDIVKVTIYNSMGQIVKTINSPDAQYINQFNISTAGMARGVYMVEVQCGNELSKTKLVVE